jgi:hypothetical protein
VLSAFRADQGLSGARIPGGVSGAAYSVAGGVKKAGEICERHVRTGGARAKTKPCGRACLRCSAASAKFPHFSPPHDRHEEHGTSEKRKDRRFWNGFVVQS